MKRLVIDTNVLIADAYNRESASARVVEACLEGRVQAVISPALADEYEFILPRAVRHVGWGDRYARFRERARWVELEAGTPPRVVTEDASDDVLFATALAGEATEIVTNDHAVREVGAYQGVRVVTPRELVEGLGGGL